MVERLPEDLEHLRALEDADLLDMEDDSRIRRYHPDATPLSEVFGWLVRYRVFREDRFDALADHLENEHQ